VLLVEDSPSDTLLVADGIRRSTIPADIVIADDGEKALEFLEKASCLDLVILDLNLPKFDGHTILKQCRPQNGPPVVVFTGSNNPVDRELALGLGAVDYIVKPVHYQAFFDAVQGILSRWTGNSRYQAAATD
jgi:DNA-binding response OmpR family regulator